MLKMFLKHQDLKRRTSPSHKQLQFIKTFYYLIKEFKNTLKINHFWHFSVLIELT